MKSPHDFQLCMFHETMLNHQSGINTVIQRKLKLTLDFNLHDKLACEQLPLMQTGTIIHNIPAVYLKLQQ